MALHRPLPAKSGPEWAGVRQRVQADRHPRSGTSRIPRANPELFPPSPSLPPLLTVPEIAAILRVSCRTVWRMVDDGRLPAVRIGRSVRVHPDAVAALMSKRRGMTDEENNLANPMWNLVS